MYEMNECDNLLHRAGWLLSLAEQFRGVSERWSYMVSEHGSSDEASRMLDGIDAYEKSAESVVAEINRALGINLVVADSYEDSAIVRLGQAAAPRKNPRRNPSAGRRAAPRRNGDMSPEALFREQMKQNALAQHKHRTANSESYDYEGILTPTGSRFHNAVPVWSHAESRSAAHGMIAQAVMRGRGVTGGEFRVIHRKPKQEPRVLDHVVIDGKVARSLLLNGNPVGDPAEHPATLLGKMRENPRRKSCR